MTKIKTICIDTLTSIQDNDYMTSVKRPDHDKWKDFSTDVYGLMVALQDRGFELVMIMGDPGTGKSTGMRNLLPDTNIWYNADNKNPVWKGGKKEYGKKSNPRNPYHVIPKTYKDITAHIDVGLDEGMFEEERIAFVIGHVETNKVGLNVKSRLKTLGNMANKMQIEGKLETVLYSEISMNGADPEYVLHTQNNGLNTARSPQGMLEPIMKNDYQAIVDAMKAYDEN
jgi:hypothetical protein